SERATASARCPSRLGLIQPRSKSSPSTSASWETTTSVPAGGAQTAASSPLPKRTPGAAVAVVSSARRRSSSASPTSARLGPGRSNPASAFPELTAPTGRIYEAAGIRSGNDPAGAGCNRQSALCKVAAELRRPATWDPNRRTVIEEEPEGDS